MKYHKFFRMMFPTSIFAARKRRSFLAEIVHISRKVIVKESFQGEIGKEVNSYHSYAVDELGKGLKVVVRTRQGDIEAIQHVDYPIFGIMWHPERVNGFDDTDRELIREKLFLG